MGIGKKYYLKLESDFFQSLKVKKLRKNQKGDTYSCIYLKLMLLSTKEFGLITFQNIENTLYEELALRIDEELEDVKKTMDFLIKEKILLQTDENEYLFENLCDQVITETEYARIMRKYRAKKKEKITNNTVQKSVKLQCHDNVNTKLLHCNNAKLQCHDNVNTKSLHCNSNELQCHDNVNTKLLHCNNSKKENNFSTNNDMQNIFLDEDIADKIISVVPINNKEKYDG